MNGSLAEPVENAFGKLEAEVKATVGQYSQQHLLTFYEELDEKEKLKLLTDIAQVDFNEIKHFRQLVSSNNT